jgi:hypothetical protein
VLLGLVETSEIEPRSDPMSLTTVIALNAALDVAVIVALAWLMRVPFRLDRTARAALRTAQTAAPDLRRAA